jgi:lactoylglutathione lyase
MKFVHVATRTKDLEAALAFYEALGLRVQRTSELKKAKATLVFITPPEENFAIELVYNWGKEDDYPGGERFGHFAFETEDIDAVLPSRPARWMPVAERRSGSCTP